MSKKARWGLLAAAVLVVVGLAAFLWFVRQKPQDTQGRGRFGLGGPMAVSVATAVTGDIPVRLAALGTVSPLATVTVKTQINGQLQQIGFQEGQAVRKGDFLAQIDPRPYQNAVGQSEGVLARDQALLANARVDLKRYEDLVAEDSVAKQQLDTQKALVQQLIGTVGTDTAQLNTAKLNLQYTHIVSPINGRAGLRQVDLGNYVTTGDPNGIVVITQLQPITVLFPVPEDNVPALLKRVRSGAVLEVKAYDRGNTKLLATGKLTTIDNQMDTTTGTVKLRASFDNQDEQLFPNQFVNIQLLVDTLHDQIIVPAAAIQHGSVNGVAGTFVYAVDTEGTASVRAVTLGAADGDSVAVTQGISVGDVVVTEGGDRLRDGAHVQVAGKAAGSGAAGGNGSNGDAASRRKERRAFGPDGKGPGPGGVGGKGPPGGWNGKRPDRPRRDDQAGNRAPGP
jgi:membrane fusion protein, multidrug efflux system